jgi:rod shape-determining protein MreC
MRRNKKQIINRISVVSFWFIIVLIALIILKNILPWGGVNNVLQDVTTTIMSPLNSAKNSVKNFLSGGQDEEIQVLQIKVSELEKQLNDYKNIEKENEFLRTQLDVVPTGTFDKAITARIIGQKPLSLSKVLVINKGTKDGVIEDQPVIAGGQLVGVISSVEDSLSEMTMITDPSLHIHAYIQDSDVFGITKGQLGSTTLLLEEIDKDYKMNVGDLVYASGQNNGLWEGLVLGEISEIQIDDRFVYQSAILKPLVNPQSIGEVLILSD